MLSQSNILFTKFFPPPNFPGYVVRESLVKKLNNSQNLPLTLVSAPAGYGKSTLISYWIQTIPKKSCWISLDKNDDNFSIFVRLLIHGIRQHFTNFGSQLNPTLKSPEKVPDQTVTTQLINALVELKEPLLLILDDYHLIKEKEIHLLVETLLKFPLPDVHLGLICRSDPPLPVVKYRSRGLVCEIRTKDLIFQTKDILKFFQQNTNKVPSQRLLEMMETQSEGWVSGLKLLTYGFEDGGETWLEPNWKSAKVGFAEMMQQFLLRITPEIKSFLLATSLTSKFNAALASHLCGFDTTKVIDHLKTANLFLIPLDDQAGWYRYHHLFAELLQHELVKSQLKEKARSIHQKAAVWFEANHTYESALWHYLDAGEFAKAIEMFQTFRIEYMNSRRWAELEQIISQLQPFLSPEIPAVQLTKAWLQVYQGKVQEMFQLLDSIADSLAQQRDSTANALLGEYYSLLVYRVYHIEQDYPLCLKLAEEAIQLMPAEHHYALGYAWIFWGGAMQAMNHTEQAAKKIHRAMEQAHHKTVSSQLLILNFMFWVEGDLMQLNQSAKQLLSHGEKWNDAEAIANGNIFMGACSYLAGDFETALKFFLEASKLRFHTVGIMSFFGDTAASYCLAFLNKRTLLEASMEEIDGLVVQEGGEIRRSFWEAYSNELLMISGSNAAAIQWVSNAPSFTLRPIANFSDPNLVLLRVCLALGTPKSLELATQLIKDLESLLVKTNNQHFMLSIRIAKAIVEYAASRRITHNFEELVTEIDHKGLVVLLIEYHKSIIPLLEHYLQHYQHNKTANSAFAILRLLSGKLDKFDLTNREVDIIRLLSKNFTNKQIAAQLFISEKTVKRHSSNLYRKLRVKNRREAARQAEALELI